MGLLLNVEYAKVEVFQIVWLLVSDGFMKIGDGLVSLHRRVLKPQLFLQHLLMGRGEVVLFILELIGDVFLLSIRSKDPWLGSFNFMALRTSINNSFSTRPVHCRSSI